MKNDYFRNHYAHMNRIDPDSERSVRQWMDSSRNGYQREIGPYVRDLAGKTILELGCGIGGTLNYLLSVGATDVTGVDHSEDQLSVCRNYVTHNVVNEDVIDFLKKADRKYDYIIALDLIEHLQKAKIGEFCRFAYASLNDGGTLILRTPNMGNLFALRSRYIDFTHEVGFTEESISQVLRDGGFAAVSVNNGYIGKKRLVCVKLFQKMVEHLYNISLSHVVTQNIIVRAVK